MTSILLTIKKMLGLDQSYSAFDTDVIIGINTALMSLKQMGIGKSDFFGITGQTETWADFLGQAKDYEGCKTYVYIKVKNVFDPPSSSFVQSAMNEQLKQIEWRLYQQAEYIDGNLEIPSTLKLGLIVDEDGDSTLKIIK